MQTENDNTESTSESNRVRFFDKRFHSEFKLDFRQHPPRHAVTLRKGLPVYETYYYEPDSFFKQKNPKMEPQPFNRIHAKEKIKPMKHGLQYLNHPKLKKYKIDFENLADKNMLDVDKFSREAICVTPNQKSINEEESHVSLRSHKSKLRGEQAIILTMLNSQFNGQPKKSRSQSKVTRTREFVFRCEQRAEWRKQTHDNCCHQNEENYRSNNSCKVKKNSVNCCNEKSAGPKEKVRGRRRRSSV